MKSHASATAPSSLPSPMPLVDTRRPGAASLARRTSSASPAGDLRRAWSKPPCGYSLAISRRTFVNPQAATQRAAAGGSPPLVAFQAIFGPGFYWFLAYCLASLASQQYTARLARSA